MLVSLTSANVNLLMVFWGLTLSFLAISIFLCAAIAFRRIWRNRQALKRDKQRAHLQSFLSLALREDKENYKLSEAPECETPEMARVLLHYFRTLKGEALERLQEKISGSEWEARLIENTREDIRGVRMRCLRTLSYLGTQHSLQVIFDNLSSKDKYVRLTAARCLVRRRTYCYLGPIIESLSEAFPRNYKLLAGVIAQFGADSIDTLESYIRRSKDGVVKTACLEAMVLIMPAKTSLNLAALMDDETESVRAAALSLSAVSAYGEGEDPLRLGLSDTATSVKIRAAKMACDLKRRDITADLYKLSDDSVMWVRYWALRAIWMSGEAGQKFVNSLAPNQLMAQKVALEMRSGYV